MKKVLLIEDDAVLRDNTAELLSLANYMVTTASDGEEGIQAALKSPPDVIVCDIMMPKKDGYAVLETLSKKPATRYIPFIFMSAKTERSDVRKGMQLGADDYLTKPFEEKELIGAIESRLAKVALLREQGALQDTGNLPVGNGFLRNINELKNYMDDHGTELQFQFGETIYRDGDHPNMVYLILKGMVKTYKIDADGKELITGIFKADDFFGFIGLHTQSVYKEYATAIEHTTLVGIGKERFGQLLEQSPELVLELVETLAANLAESKDQLLQMAYGSVRKKTATTILRFAEKLLKDPDQEHIHIMRTDLAAVAGMATETLIRTLSQFKKEGLIGIQERDIYIMDMEGLRKIQ